MAGAVAELGNLQATCEEVERSLEEESGGSGRRPGEVKQLLAAKSLSSALQRGEAVCSAQSRTSSELYDYSLACFQRKREEKERKKAHKRVVFLTGHDGQCCVMCRATPPPPPPPSSSTSVCAMGRGVQQVEKKAAEI